MKRWKDRGPTVGSFPYLKTAQDLESKHEEVWVQLYSWRSKSYFSTALSRPSQTLFVVDLHEMTLFKHILQRSCVTREKSSKAEMSKEYLFTATAWLIRIVLLDTNFRLQSPLLNSTKSEISFPKIIPRPAFFRSPLLLVFLRRGSSSWWGTTCLLP